MPFGQMSHEQNGHLAPPAPARGLSPTLSPPQLLRCRVGAVQVLFVVTTTEMVPGWWRHVPGQGPSSRSGSPCQLPPPSIHGYTWAFTLPQHQGETGGFPLPPHSRAALWTGEQGNASRKGCAESPEGPGDASWPRAPQGGHQVPFPEGHTPAQSRLSSVTVLPLAPTSRHPVAASVTRPLVPTGALTGVAGPGVFHGIFVLAAFPVQDLAVPPPSSPPRCGRGKGGAGGALSPFREGL